MVPGGGEAVPDLQIIVTENKSKLLDAEVEGRLRKFSTCPPEVLLPQVERVM